MRVIEKSATAANMVGAKCPKPQRGAHFCARTSVKANAAAAAKPKNKLQPSECFRGAAPVPSKAVATVVSRAATQIPPVNDPAPRKTVKNATKITFVPRTGVATDTS